MRRLKMTPLGKGIIAVLIFALISTALFKFGVFTTKKSSSKGRGSVGSIIKLPTLTKVSTDSGDITLSLDSWVGWKPIIDANGGLETKSGSIFDKLGLKVHIKNIDDGSQSSSALIANKLTAAGYTVNRYSFLYDKFKSNNTPVKMVYITNASAGGDGIIAKSGINSVEQLVGKKVGIPKFSEAQTLVEWLMAHSSLTSDQIAQIRKDAVMFDTPDDAAKALFSGKIDAAATWEPFLTQANQTAGTHVLFSTKSATNIILDGIVFRQDYMNKYPQNVQKFVQGALQGIDLYGKDNSSIKDVFETFATSSDSDLKSMEDTAVLADYSKNKELLGGVAQQLFTDMSNIWLGVGEKAYPNLASEAFDSTAVKALADQFPDTKPQQIQFTDAQRQAAKAQDDNSALLKQTLTISFDTGASTIKAESYASINKFAENAKILNGVIIQIEGNTDNVGDAASNKTLSEQRAKAVATYLQYQGIDPTRFVVVGNGQDKPVASNNTDDGKAKNRRTDVYFKVVTK